jgi:tetrahydromethanopterin S-methyltransferase subunit G
VLNLGGKSMRRSWNPEEIEKRINEIERKHEKIDQEEAAQKKRKSVEDVFG